MMTKRDFEIIAETINNMDCHPSIKRYVAERMASALRRASLNPRFDVDRFVARCMRGEL